MKKPTVLFIALLISATVFSQRSTIVIPAQYHPLNEPLIAVLDIPDNATTENKLPICIVVHGSGGLFSEGDAGDGCNTSIDNVSGKFEDLMDLFHDNQIASIAPSSFVSRDSRFCEDKGDFIEFMPPPFFNPGDGDEPIRNSLYKMRRIVIRTLDLFATMNYACSLNNIDCSRSCTTGTSNGGSTILSYVANDLGRHLNEYTNINIQREHESSGNFEDRIDAFQNFPALPNDIIEQLNQRNLPLFSDAISPGCKLRNIIPDIEPDDEYFIAQEHLNDLYYPALDSTLYLEIGTDDDIPDECYGEGIRNVQALAFETLSEIAPQKSRYINTLYPGAPHDLLGEDKVGEGIIQKIEDLSIHHFFLIYKNGFE